MTPEIDKAIPVFNSFDNGLEMSTSCLKVADFGITDPSAPKFISAEKVCVNTGIAFTSDNFEVAMISMIP